MLIMFIFFLTSHPNLLWYLRRFPGHLHSPTIYYLVQEADPHPATSSFQRAVKSGKVLPKPHLLPAEQPQLPQLLRTLPKTLPHPQHTF